jgi:multisubunit Na+/H+ antiporter MnhB subunit
MRKLIAGIVLFLSFASAFAQRALEEGANAVTSEPVDMIWVAVFGVIFVGMIVYFFWYLWRSEQRRKLGEE